MIEGLGECPICEEFRNKGVALIKGYFDMHEINQPMPQELAGLLASANYLMGVIHGQGHQMEFPYAILEVKMRDAHAAYKIREMLIGRQHGISGLGR